MGIPDLNAIESLLPKNGKVNFSSCKKCNENVSF